MAELDIDLLKWYAEIGYGCPELQGQLPAIIAALEDRDRLRVVAQVVLTDAFPDSGYFVIRPATLRQVQAALEHRDG